MALTPFRRCRTGVIHRTDFIIADLCLPRNVKGVVFMKIRWYEIVILAMTALCALLFLLTWLDTARSPGVWISTGQGGVFRAEDGAAPEPGADAAAEKEPGADTAVFPVDLNAADAQALEAVPGIGPWAAQAILDYRAAHGSFHSVEELLEVEGIGAVLLDKIRGCVTVAPGAE